tara:strand:- start:111 stop:314 length:204 start_codon:yes stop_codon:yes gene_type:complete
MPNKISPSKQHTSITLPRTLIARLDEIAVSEERSRNQVIELLLRKQIANYDDNEKLTTNEPQLGAPA